MDSIKFNIDYEKKFNNEFVRNIYNDINNTLNKRKLEV